MKFPLIHLKQFEQLYIKYPDTLICSCNEISIKYAEFIKLTPVYHEICSSAFISLKWINYLDFTYLNGFSFDYSNLSPSFQPQILRSLCQLVEETVNSNLIQFHSRTFISNQLISKYICEKRINNTIYLFQNSTRQTFKQIFELTREIFHGNALITIDDKRSWKEEKKPINDNIVYMRLPSIYSDETCSCATSLNCSGQAMMKGVPTHGFFIGCYPIEAMLRSTLECLYKKSCLNLISSNYEQNSSNFPIELLQLKTRYNINETIQNMIDRLFVDKWNVNYSYLNYSNKCHSTECTNSIIQQFHMLYVVTSIINLHGWLTMLLRLLIPLIINISFRMYYRRRQMVIVPNVTTKI
ncbi:unnamed protein product [Adineta ricciae]|uniref:Uncharacterized protein n=1 Tax=Adineta ricciae TaxID=249248 RepID=A0A816G6C8_ADIRI|nr:unnamed protein product [Adineta ricciae]